MERHKKVISTVALLVMGSLGSLMVTQIAEASSLGQKSFQEMTGAQIYCEPLVKRLDESTRRNHSVNGKNTSGKQAK